MSVFQVRWQETVGGPYTTLTLVPMPVAKEYPERRALNVRVGQDGNVVVQRPMKDDRPRKWVWERMSDRVPAYTSMWTSLKALEYRTRLQANKPPLVEIWEGVTDEGGFGRLSGSTRIFTKVKFLQVHRVMASGAGSVYEQSFVEFYIEDSTYTEF
jgi:hypothetical protein